MSGWRFFWRNADRRDPLGFGSLTIARQELGHIIVIRPLSAADVDEGLPFPEEPTINFSDGSREQFQQSMMDSLWAEGVRPSDHKLTTQAAEKHLEDMRKIVAHTLKMAL